MKHEAKRLFNNSKEGRTEGGKREVDKKKRKGGGGEDQMACLSKVERIRKIKDGTSRNSKNDIFSLERNSSSHKAFCKRNI